MANTTKKGLTVYKAKYGGDNTGGRNRYLLKNGYGTALGEGDPVKVSNGFVKVAANSSAGVTGVFAGCKYIDSATRQPVETGYWPASTSSGGLLEGETHALAYVMPAEAYTFLMESEASVSASLIGGTFAVSVGTPDSLMKRSKAVMKATVATSADVYMVRLLSFPNIAGSAADQNPTVVEVEIVSPRLVYA